MSEGANLQQRLDYMEEKFDSRFNQMAEAMSTLAKNMSTLSERVSDMTLLNERSNQHAEMLKSLHEYGNTLDVRLDEIEKQMPLIKRFIDRSDKISLAVTILLVTGVIGSFFMFA